MNFNLSKRSICKSLTFLSLMTVSLQSQGIIIDHNCTDISKIPVYWINEAKKLTLHYAHTSHGHQIIEGINILESQNSLYSVSVRENGIEGLPPVENPPALRIYDGNPTDIYIIPEFYWSTADGMSRVRGVANTGKYSCSMWAWCGQVSSYTSNQIQAYLDSLRILETEYRSMRFIYMTGHLDGTGSQGTLHVNNQMIRNYCRNNNKVLFDFADIERYNPDGTDFLNLGANDNCDYSGGNWANNWCTSHPGSPLCQSCNCAHSQPLNCNVKARAFWWMMARLAGWPGPAGPAAPSVPASSPQLIISVLVLLFCAGTSVFVFKSKILKSKI